MVADASKIDTNIVKKMITLQKKTGGFRQQREKQNQLDQQLGGPKGKKFGILNNFINRNSILTNGELNGSPLTCKNSEGLSDEEELICGSPVFRDKQFQSSSNVFDSAVKTKKDTSFPRKETPHKSVQKYRTQLMKPSPMMSAKDYKELYAHVSKKHKSDMKVTSTQLDNISKCKEFYSKLDYYNKGSF